MKSRQFLKSMRDKSKAELITAVKDRRQKLETLRFDLISGKTKNVKDIKNTKKEIARLLTIYEKKN